jgi:hypothetical protein
MIGFENNSEIKIPSIEEMEKIFSSNEASKNPLHMNDEVIYLGNEARN